MKTCPCPPLAFRFITVVCAVLLLTGCSKSGREGQTDAGSVSPPLAAPGGDAADRLAGPQPTAEAKSGGHGQSSPERQPAAQSAAAEQENEAEEAEKMPDLGQPQVDNPEDIVKLQPDSPVWLDKKNGRVVLIGAVCRANYPLEFFATYPDRAYESVVVIYTRPSVVHAALLALGAVPGKPVQYDPKFVPPSGTEVEIDLAWQDSSRKRQKARAQEWIRDIKTKKQLDVNWVFAGSLFWEDKETGEKSYLADRGDFISVLNLPTALLDVPIASASAIESRLFEGFVERLPPPGTPVTMILKPKLQSAGKIDTVK
jgi:hypothetical protein